jgi:AcrR family transcriptional regulator
MRYDKILETARTAFLIKGHSATSINDILSTSQDKLGNIYYYFKSKDDLFLKVCETETSLRNLIVLKYLPHEVPTYRLTELIQNHPEYNKINEETTVLDLYYKRRVKNEIRDIMIDLCESSKTY